ncbi:hypothetical protein CCY99_00095 [Helicobacter sp. 16-1353]|uniref:M23 family metallopeptidase n=1 Tax=Helicobacter sp. 16-1353 TaxID=2004996 RepID=UPI000DCC9E65|nr:M23 family metallopeptidase [Helicobacter sp. 16-1353]RAX55136.1 hypothetical protein CCY99_00095 [Helicobacter sp. 16-1353]
MRKKKNNFLFFLVLIICVGIAIFIYSSSKFEREKPNIDIPDISYWNLKWDIPIKISDSSGIKSYKIIFIKDDEETILISKKGNNQKNIELILPIPKINISNGDKLQYRIEATDNSFFRFFLGNTSNAKLEFTIDTKIPVARIVAMSNKITKGGSAAVVFFAKDENLANISISNGYQSFVAFPFLKENYYVSIIPWSIHNPSFRGLITIQDKAGNVKKSNIGFAKYSKVYRTSHLALKNSFIDGKVAELIENANEFSLYDFTSRFNMFRYVNETIRGRDEATIKSKILNLDLTYFTTDINVFKPLKDFVIVGLYGDHRKYTIDKQPAGESYHLGTDLANVKNAQVTNSNDGVVVLSESLGIYGNTVMIDHGFGISSLYSHLSEIYVSEGDEVKKGSIIGRTGISGFAFGDHLHFEIRIQGTPVLSTEWMDSKWLKVNINDILVEAKSIIENR